MSNIVNLPANMPKPASHSSAIIEPEDVAFKNIDTPLHEEVTNEGIAQIVVTYEMDLDTDLWFTPGEEPTFVVGTYNKHSKKTHYEFIDPSDRDFEEIILSDAREDARRDYDKVLSGLIRTWLIEE